MKPIDINDKQQWNELRDQVRNSWDRRTHGEKPGFEHAAEMTLYEVYMSLRDAQRLPVPGDEMLYGLNWQDEECGPLEIETPQDAGDQVEQLLLAVESWLLAPYWMGTIERTANPGDLARRCAVAARGQARECGQDYAKALAERYGIEADGVPVADVNVSWERVTPESAENGEADARGRADHLSRQCDAEHLRALLEGTEASQSPITTPWSAWYTLRDHDGDMTTGAQTHYSYHPGDEGSAELMADMWRRCQS